MTPFGLFGPYRDYRETDGVINAMAGLMSVTGDPEREPLRNAGSLAAMGAGLNAFVATVAALYGREEPGEGDRLDVGIFDHIATLLEVFVQMWVDDGTLRRRTGNRAGPHWGLFPAAEGHVAVTLRYRRELALMGEAFGMAELGSERYDDYLSGKAKHMDEIEALLQAALLSGPAREVYGKAQSARLPWGYVTTFEELAESEQLRARGFWTELDHPAAGRLTYPTTPVLIDGGGWRSERAPLLGEHNEEILCGRLGLAREDMPGLRAAGVI